MQKSNEFIPDHTAIRTALWRALHVQIDPPPHIFSDEIGLKLVGEENWRDRQDMEPAFSKGMRASIVGRARFIEDLIEEEVENGVLQYVILGAGLDTFAQRRPELASKLQIFEVDQPGPQIWKQKRLTELGLAIPSSLHFVPVDFEIGQSWPDQLILKGLDLNRPTVIVSTGVSMYLTKEANLELLRQITKLSPGSTFAMTFMLTPELLEEKEKLIMEFVMKKTSEAGTPFLSLYSPSEILNLANEVGFKKSKCITGKDIYLRYFSNRTDGLNAGNAEAFLVVKN